MTAEERFEWKSEYDVITTLRAIGHEVKALGVQDELRPIREAVDEFKPDIAFNLLEEFHSNVLFDQNVVSLLELLRVPYTGCNPRGMIISREKSLAKKLLVFHRIPVPMFHVFPLKRKTKRPKQLEFPLIVKSLTDHASLGISQNSLVHNDEELDERVKFIHRRIGSDALVEQFIVGREIYVGVMGNDRLKALPPRELIVGSASPSRPLIATEKVKHDPEYQERHNIEQKEAQNLPPGMEKELAHRSKRIYKILMLSGYARLDYRLSPDGKLWFLEANPNPEIAKDQEFSSSADDVGMDYPALLQRILQIGLRGTTSQHS